MSARLASELCELAAPRPSFRLSAPHALAAPAAAAHARARSPSSPLRGSRGSRAPGPAPVQRKAGVSPGRGARPHSLPLSPWPFGLSMASHQQSRIQAYLEKNRIGPLFEVRRWGAGGPVCLRKKGVQNTPEGSTGREGRHRRGAPVAPVLWHSLCPGQVSWNAAARSPLRLPGRGQVNSGRAGLTQAGIV